MTTEIVWLVGRYAFLGLLYLFVLLVLRALVMELRAEASPLRPVRYEAAPAPADEPNETSDLGKAADRAEETVPTARALPPRVVVVETPDPASLPIGTAFSLMAVTTMGRGPHSTVSLAPDQYASTNHALIVVRDLKAYLRDRGSKNGTLLNGQLVEGEAELQDGDRVTVGMTVLRFSAGDAFAQPGG